MRLLVLVLILLFPFVARADDTVLPDHARTPGAINQDITQDNIGDNICKGHGWSTKSIRPKSSYTSKLKKRQLADWGYKDKTMRSYEEDHLVSLEIGGHPSSPLNLWPQSYSGQWNARVKDKLENTLHRMVCDHSITLQAAQEAISTDWVAAYKKYVH